MPKFLLDANLSYRTVLYLQSLGYEATSVAQLRLSGADDETIARYALEHGYIAATFDLDFGFLFHRLAGQSIGIIILRLEDQRKASVHATLTRLLETKILTDPANQQALIVIDENTIRIHH